MKLNGALKPRQGASVQGSSPGVVLRKYRIKRYYKPTAPLKQRQQKRGESLSNSDSKNNSNNSSNTSCSLSSSSSSCSFNTSIKSNKFENKSTTPNTKRRRNLTTLTAEFVLTAVAERTNKTNIDINLKEQTANENITTRQIKNKTQTNIENNFNYSNNKDDKKAQQRKVFKRTYNNTNSNSDGDNVVNTTNNEVNKFLLFSPNSFENLSFSIIISRFIIQLNFVLFCMFSHAIKYLTGNSVVRCVRRGGRGGCGSDTITVCHSFGLAGYNLEKIMRASQSLAGSFERICFRNVHKTRLPPSIALCLMVYATTVILLPQLVVCDDGDSFFPINGLETTTPEFDYASRGQKKFGDKCENTLECGFPGSICDPKKKSCQCTEDLPVTNHIDKCGKEAAVNESCFFNEQCEVKYFQTECRDQRCVCRFDMSPIWLKDGSVECKGRGDKKGPETYIDPAMIGVLIGMALMFIIICVVLRLFSQARWRENRTIFNTPNPRLMNVSLLRESKLLHGQERRGSRMSVRAPSRQPSMASLRPHSPNPSLGKTGSRSNSHGSNASATSLRSTRSNSVSPAGIVVNNSHHERKSSTYQQHHHQHPSQQQQQQQLQSIQQQEEQPLTQTNIISNPVAETVTVEIIEPEK